MLQEVMPWLRLSRRPFPQQTVVRLRVISREICDGQSGTGIVVFWEYLLRFSIVSSFPTALHSYLHAVAPLTKNDKRANRGNIGPKRMSFEFGRHWTEKCLHVVRA